MPVTTAIKKNDEVYVLRGKDRGKTGRVLIVMPKDQKVVVEGIQTIKRENLAPRRTIGSLRRGYRETTGPVSGSAFSRQR